MSHWNNSSWSHGKSINLNLKSCNNKYLPTGLLVAFSIENENYKIVVGN